MTAPGRTSARSDLTRSLAASFRFHAALESPVAFLGREKVAITLFGGAFVAVILIALFVPDVAFFYPRIETDQLLYLLKAKSLVETGSTAAHSAVNAPPFPYAAMPGILRAPFMLMFDDFDLQIRGMQLLNVAIATLTGFMSAYVLSWALPERLHRWAVGFAYGFMVVNPDWLTNIFVPLADAPYAAATLACIIIAARLIPGAAPLGSRRRLIALWALLFAVAFGIRYTAPVLLAYAAVLLRQRWSGRTMSRRARIAIIAIPVVALSVLVVLNAEAIFGRYLTEPLAFLFMADKAGIFLNLFGSAIPAQIIPGFNIGFAVRPLATNMHPVFGSNPRDVMWTAFGIAISAVTLWGMVQSRDRFLPEILYFLAPLPVLGLMIPSTARYLMSYDALLWMWFAIGVAALTRPLRKRLAFISSPIALGAAAALAASGILAMRTARTARTSGAPAGTGAVGAAMVYMDDVAATYRHLRDFIEGLPADRTLLIGGRGTQGRWKLIAGRNYYRPDPGLVRISREKEVYLVLECATAAQCSNFDRVTIRVRGYLDTRGSFTYEPVFSEHTANAAAIVYRIRPIAAASEG